MGLPKGRAFPSFYLKRGQGSIPPTGVAIGAVAVRVAEKLFLNAKRPSGIAGSAFWM